MKTVMFYVSVYVWIKFLYTHESYNFIKDLTKDKMSLVKIVVELETKNLLKPFLIKMKVKPHKPHGFT